MTTTQTWAFHWIVPDKVADEDIESWAQREWADEVGVRATADAPEVTLLLTNVPPAPPSLRRPPRIVRVVGKVT